MKWIKRLLICSVATSLLLVGIIWLITFHPSAIMHEEVYNSPDVPLIKPGQKVKVLSWNVQYMAGKNYVFFYDVPDEEGPHSAPSAEDVEKTFHEVVRVIKEENPDIILLQELDDGAKRTGHMDQLAMLMSMLPADYKSHCSTFYWKNLFCPHSKIMGSTGMKLSTISKYKITEAIRYQLEQMPGLPILKYFNFNRAVFKTKLPIEGGQDFYVLNTHLSAFSHGSDTLEKQVAQIYAILTELNKSQKPWIIGGDFNLLVPGQHKLLPDHDKEYYKPETELMLLINNFNIIPRVEDITGKDAAKWITHFCNDPRVCVPDRTLDYIFYSKNLELNRDYKVRQADTMAISDHFPVISTFKLPK